MMNSQTPWRYEIKCGPDDEASHAWIYDDNGEFIAVMKIHKAKQIVDAMNARALGTSCEQLNKAFSNVPDQQENEPGAHGERELPIDRFDSVDPSESIGCYGGSGQWIELGTVADIRALSSPDRADAGKVEGDGSAYLERFWRPISEADKSITFEQTFDTGDGKSMTIRNSDHYWVRDADGRVYEATWSDHKGGYWWDLEGESPVDPVEYMPHPLSLPSSPSQEVAGS
ncbi:hypothetical protein [Brucella intermedia]|uniref:hypothetical protein n=1 Tax=Brucella intermedia TaxID=94625 RepID=UPI0015896ADA|nr:hypothetical protein [Brucella intermedia]NYD84402.1 hypothetical protein [Brucella intermedia]